MAVVITPIRSDNAYFGLGKEVTPGTPVAPTYFPRWEDGSKIEIDCKIEEIWEGDGSRHLSLAVKNLQMVKIKLVCRPRANEMGFLEMLAMGTGSDAYTAPTTNTTLSSASSVGATTISVAANTGLTGSTQLPLVLGTGLATEEIALFLPPVTGAGPYTLNVAAAYNGGLGLKTAHLSAAAVQGPSTHLLTDQTAGQYVTVEVGLGSLFSGPGTTLRVRSCMVDTIKRSAKAGSTIQYEVDLIGIATTVGSPSTVTLEQHPVFLFTQGVWTLDGLLTGDALTVKLFDITQKNILDTSIQTEQLNLAALLFGNVTFDVNLTVVYTIVNHLAITYFGGQAGTTDSQTLVPGSLTLVFTNADTFEVVTYTLPSFFYSKAVPPVPKKDGKHFELPLTAFTTSNQGVNLFEMSTTLNNTTYAAY